MAGELQRVLSATKPLHYGGLSSYPVWLSVNRPVTALAVGQPAAQTLGCKYGTLVSNDMKTILLSSSLVSLTAPQKKTHSRIQNFRAIRFFP